MSCAVTARLICVFVSHMQKVGFLMTWLKYSSFFFSVAACIEEDGVRCLFAPTSGSTLHNFGDVVTFTCDTGYNHSTGDLVRTCQNTGQWTGTAPTCTSKAQGIFYTPGIYAEDYIVFVFQFVCSLVRLFIRSYFLPSRGICVKVLR